MTVNVLPAERIEEQVSHLLALIGQQVRVQILTIIGVREACVCHLEAALGCRQASISQHLMVLRKAGLVTTHREGRNIFYRLAEPGVMELLQQAARLAGADPGALARLADSPVIGCTCPLCNPDLDPDFTCQKKSSCSSSRN